MSEPASTWLMGRIYAVIELADGSTFDPDSDDDLDALAEDLLSLVHGAAGSAVYTSAKELIADEP